MTLPPAPLTFPRRLLSGFVATLIFHQLVLAMLWSARVASFGPFQMAATKPFGVPFVFSLAFWGGVWGLPNAVLERRFPTGMGYWVMAFLFGAVLPSLVVLLVVFPLKSLPLGGGWHPSLLVTAFLINGAWGIGNGVIIRSMLD
jgi:hypothetical protein